MPEPIDVVITWVDDTWPGYLTSLWQHAQRPVDHNPNRTRDNLDLLKYNLRTLWRYMPWFRRVILVTARPQLPPWLNTQAPKLTIVHHDALFDAANLPSFNSLGIVAHLGRIPHLTRRFLYIEDDRLLGAQVHWHDLFAPCGRPWLYATGPNTPRAQAHPSPRQHPWSAALAYSNHLLDEAHGPKRRLCIKNAPVVFDTEALTHLEARFAHALQQTRASRFRAPGNVALEHLAPYDMYHLGEARLRSQSDARRMTAYWGLDNWGWRVRWGLMRMRQKQAHFLCLNDNFGASPNPTCVQQARDFLQAHAPWPSPFEHATTARKAESHAG